MSPTPGPANPERHGRTSWWPCDAAEHDRELHVELGEEFGPLGPYVMRVLKDLAQQQRSATVRSGFRVMRTKTFAPSTDDVRAVIERAAEIGALDDLRIDEDGRRFTCRISGLEADSERGRAALRKQDQRDRESRSDVTSPELSHPDGTNGELSRPVPVNRDNQNKESGDPSAAVVPPDAAAALHPAFIDVMAIAQEAYGKDSTLQPPQDFAIERTLRAYPHADHLRAANLAASDLLSGRRTTRHFEKVLADQLADQAKAPPGKDRRSEREQREADDLAALRSLQQETARVD